MLTVFAIVLFVLGAAAGCLIATLCEMHNEEVQSQSRINNEWKLVMNGNKELLTRSYESLLH